jgi:hypothetical protein
LRDVTLFLTYIYKHGQDIEGIDLPLEETFKEIIKNGGLDNIVNFDT